MRILSSSSRNFMFIQHYLINNPYLNFPSSNNVLCSCLLLSLGPIRDHMSHLVVMSLVPFYLEQFFCPPHFGSDIDLLKYPNQLFYRMSHI